MSNPAAVSTAANPFLDDFDLISMILLKSTESRSFDDILCLRNFIFKFEWVREFFKPVVHLGLINDFCKAVTLGVYNQGQMIHRQGDIGDRMYFIVDGNLEMLLKYRVDLTKDEFEERERIEHRINFGMCIGEEVMTTADIRPSSAVCVSHTAHAMTISKSAIRTIAKDLKLDVAMAGQGEQYRCDSKKYVMSVLSKARHWRNDNEIDHVSKYLKQRIPFFERFSLDQQQELCRIAETTSLTEQTILFKQGQVGQAFYIVLHGSVDVYVTGVDKESREREPSHGGGGSSVASGSTISSQQSMHSMHSMHSLHSTHSMHSAHSAHSAHGGSQATLRSAHSYYSNVEGYGKHVHTIP
jgi:CRP-like cAMP-binding protein